MHRTDDHGGDCRPRDGAAVQLPPQQEPRPFQFTLRTMFLATTVVAVVFGGLSAPADWEWVRYLTLYYVAVAVPLVLVVVLIYGRGYVRTFAIGALFPAGFLIWAVAFNLPGLTLQQYDLPDDPESRRLILMLGTAIAAALILLSGAIAVVVRRMVERPRFDWDPSKVIREPATGDGTLSFEDHADPAYK